MPYQIVGSNELSSIGHTRETLEEAKALAQELKARGFTNIAVKDAAGTIVWVP